MGVNIQNLQLRISRGLKASHVKIHIQLHTLQCSSVFQGNLRFAAPVHQSESKEGYVCMVAIDMTFYEEMSNPSCKSKKAVYLMAAFQRWVPQNCTEKHSSLKYWALGLQHWSCSLFHALPLWLGWSLPHQQMGNGGKERVSGRAKIKGTICKAGLSVGLLPAHGLAPC